MFPMQPQGLLNTMDLFKINNELIRTLIKRSTPRRADTFPEQQYSIRARTPEARSMGWAFFLAEGRRAASGRGRGGRSIHYIILCLIFPIGKNPVNAILKASYIMRI
jgi:hypothetical protein